jgi:hypothetical protein
MNMQGLNGKVAAVTGAPSGTNGARRALRQFNEHARVLAGEVLIRPVAQVVS